MQISANGIAILDFGSQYTHLIARRIRELGVISHIYPTDVSSKKLKNAWGVILSGGPKSVVSEKTLPYDPDLFTLGIPILGLCYGHQLLAQHFGGMVGAGKAREYGQAQLTVHDSDIFKNIPKETTVWMSHGDHVEEIPPGWQQIGSSGGAAIAAMHEPNKQFYGFQFHPEVYHSSHGRKMLSNFIFEICRAKKNWNQAAQFKTVVEEIRQAAGTKKVFLLVSGGVDSTVCFALLEKVLGTDRVYGLHVDSGLMRLDETKKITTSLKQAGFTNLHIYQAKKEFLNRLKNVIEPETKRKIIGDTFLDIVDRIMKEKKMDAREWLVGQGTIYPDTIESGGTKNAVVIKTHHNRVPRIQRMIAEGKIIEPLKELYKDEVRAIGRRLKLPTALIERHPFPGPGLGIRILCSAGSPERATLIKGDGFPLPRGNDTFGTGSIYCLPIKSVGVQGDERSYAHPAVIVANTAVGRRNIWRDIERLAPGITNRHREINRVILTMQGDEKKLLTARMYRATLTKKRIQLLQKIDQIVHSYVLPAKSCKHIWQLPVVLVPFGYRHKESVVLRPFQSEEVMTASFAKIPEPILKKILRAIGRLKAVDFIFYDVTNKPPGTIEWE